MPPAPTSPPAPHQRAADPLGFASSHLVSRGSAPSGVFDIPSDGLQVPQAKSFLAKFQAGIRIRPPGKDPPPQNVETMVTPSNTNVELEPRPEPQQEKMKPPPDPAVDVSPPTAASSPPKPVRLPGTPVRSGPSPDVGPAPSPVAAALEAAADEAEDVLINVIPNTHSLLSERRSFYPVLRFCAASALLDQHALDTLSLPLGFVWAPFGSADSVPRLSRPPRRCGTCGSFVAAANGGETVRDGQRSWTCAFCGRDDNDAGEAAAKNGTDSTLFPELSLDAVQYVHPESAARSAAGRGAIVLVVDENLDPEEASWARASTAAVHASAAENGLRFALLTVGAGCSVAAQYKNPEETVPVLDVMSQDRAAKLLPEEKEQFFLPPPSAESSGNSSVQDDTAVASAYTDVFIRHRSSPTLEAEHPDYVEPIEEDDEPAPKQRTRLPPEEETRRLDVAINVAFELISGMADAENSRILCLLTGPATLPPFSVDAGREGFFGRTGPDPEAVSAALSQLYEHIGTRAGDLRVALDFLCFGAPNGFAGTILLAAAKRSRGGLVYSAAHNFSAGSALAEAVTFLSQRSTRPGVVSIRVSSPLAVARVIGPAFPTAAPQTYAVPGIDPTTGFTVILKPKQGVEEEKEVPSHAIVQLAAKSLESTRVITVRIPLTNSSTEYSKSLDAEICALVLGKACVVSGGALTQPHIASRSIDVSVRRLLRGSEASAGVVRLLFELRRGLLIERIVDPDCALVLRSFFLRAECSIASLLMSPRLFTNAMSDEGTGLMAEVPLEKSYITKDAMLVLDTGFNVFVYVGEGASAEAEEAISESARAVAAQRFSPCQLWKLRPGRDAEYLLDTYLSPTEPAKVGVSASPTDQGFIQYCKSLAPDSITVRLLQSA